MSATLTVELRVMEASPLPDPVGKKLWSLRCKLLRLISGSPPRGISEIIVLVHSPTKTFAMPAEELPHYVFVVAFADPISNPYSGRIQVLGSHKAVE
jgi:hypothetical protein